MPDEYCYLIIPKEFFPEEFLKSAQKRNYFVETEFKDLYKNGRAEIISYKAFLKRAINNQLHSCFSFRTPFYKLDKMLRNYTVKTK